MAIKSVEIEHPFVIKKRFNHTYNLTYFPTDIKAYSIKALEIIHCCLGAYKKRSDGKLF